MQRPAPSGGWALLRAVASVRTLWIALAALLVAARWALNGVVRDAHRRTRKGAAAEL